MAYKQNKITPFTQKKDKVGPFAEPTEESGEQEMERRDHERHANIGTHKASVGLHESGVKPNELGEEGRKNYNKYLKSLNKK